MEGEGTEWGEYDFLKSRMKERQGGVGGEEEGRAAGSR